jgi:dipeptidyl aminopeptidase/acylaminoacyl peptidase
VAPSPELYKCAVSIAGIADLAEFVTYRRKKWGSDSEPYLYSLKSIGDPKTSSAQPAAKSPARPVSGIKAPILLVHGEDDDNVPIAQSKLMKQALDKAGRATELIALKDEGHSYWSDASEKRTLIAIDRFLWQHIGAGHGTTAPPLALPARAR